MDLLEKMVSYINISWHLDKKGVRPKAAATEFLDKLGYSN